MYEPPFCPNDTCPRHRDPGGRFYIRRGTYRTKCRPQPVPRFSCRTCQRWFSRQTFRADYRDHKPGLNMKVLTHLCSGVGFRQTARMVGMTRRNLVLKARKLARVGVLADRNLQVQARRRALIRGGPGSGRERDRACVALLRRVEGRLDPAERKDDGAPDSPDRAR